MFIPNYRPTPSATFKLEASLFMSVSFFLFLVLLRLPPKEVALALFYEYHVSIFLVEYFIIIATWVCLFVAAVSLMELIKSYFPAIQHPLYFSTEGQTSIMSGLSKLLFLSIERGVQESYLLEHYRLSRKNKKMYLSSARKKKPFSEIGRYTKETQEEKAEEAVLAAMEKLKSLDTLHGAIKLHIENISIK